ncbi:tubulin binding cofactor A [Annulohypoxylon maeteangense]|uniref:tubulin binding cofactor A n=1 Tax=Annulohypoxylon maeteangense TaxID=1927788 RepID=UPI0020076B4A|nr:tubulin binding cofactor A [Annulohypoxylon maeteangense]KAI0889688.1 tubulin binding cofactor A [Annulohypoxylon maeteangense]
MPAPSPLTIATQSVQRLVKEEKYYRKELEQQNERLKRLETELKAAGEGADGNAGFVLKQEQKARDETKAVFAPLNERIVEAVQRLEEQIAAAESEEGSPEEIKKANEALELGKSVEEPPAA